MRIVLAALLLAAMPALAHDAYTHLRNPEGQLCCNGDDCAVWSHPVIEKPEGFYLHDGRFVPRHKAQPSFDEVYHLCEYPIGSGIVRCFLYPNSGA